MEQLNLQSQNLTIHYFSFNISGSFQKDYLRKIAFYLFKSFGFNSTFKRKQLDQRETFFSSDKNSYEVIFIHYDYIPKAKSFWRGPKLILPVRMPNTFIIKLKKTNWIGRFLILQNSFLLELIFII